MFVEIDGLKIFYQKNANIGNPILILHGWGCSSKTVDCIFSFLDKIGKSVVSIDFLGFGQSETPPANFTIFDYAQVTAKLLKLLQIEKPDVIAHSFGGRVALVMADQGIINRLIITGGAGMKPRRKLSYYFRVFSYKIKRKLGLNTDKYGSNDYKNLSKNMQRVFVSVVNTHLEKTAKRIKTPTLLVWGKYDKETPLYMANKMKKLIKGSELIVLDGGHFVFLEKPTHFCLIANAFFKESK